MTDKVQNVTDTIGTPALDKRQIIAGAVLGVAAVAAVVVARRKLAGRFPVDVDVNVAAPKKS